MGAFIVVLIIVGIAWAIKKGLETAKLRQAENDTFTAQHKGWDIYVSPVDQSVLALNHDAAQIVLGRVTAYQQYPWTAIATVEVLRDGGSITSTNRGSQVAGAAVGGILLGGVGLLVGGLSGSKRTQQTINEVAIKLIVDDRVNPVHTIPFFRFPGKGLDPNHVMVKQTLAKLDHYHALLVNAVRAAQIPVRAPQEMLASTGAQLAQLWSLKEAGALTEAEFADQKVALLGGKIG